jgi:hypothetical protein
MPKMKLRTVLSFIAVCGSSACTPNNAVLTSGEYMVFFSESTSRTILFDAVDFDKVYKTMRVDCQCEVTVVDGDAANCPDAESAGGCYTCQEFEDYIDDPESGPDTDVYLTDLCWSDYNPVYDFDDDEDGVPDVLWWNENPITGGNGTPHFGYESWLHYDTFRVVQEPLNPWRGEAIITTEGDFQVTFHHRMGGDDLRFAFAIEPDFQPEVCVGSGDEIAAEPVDGDWLGNWSREVDDGTMYFLNAGAYQFNPSNVDIVWFFPQDWSAGYSEAKVGDEDFVLRSARYGDPFAYGEYETLSSLYDIQLEVDDLFYVDLDAEDDPDTDNVENDPLTADFNGDGVPDFEELKARMDSISDTTYDEFDAFTQAFESVTPNITDLGDVTSAISGSGDETMAYRPVTHTNDWRAPDGVPDGLDGWGEMHYNWVRIASGSDLTVGGSAAGEFSLTLEALDSQSRMLIRGSFEVEKIKAEKWGAYDVQQERLDELGTTLCVDTR